MGSMIHPMAVVDPKAQLGENVTIGPFAIVEADTVVGDGCQIHPHAFIGTHTTIGQNCQIYHGAICGTIAQDLKFKGEVTTLEIGENTIIREYCTIHKGTSASGKTIVGKNCAILAYGHIAHDCVLRDHVVASNNLGLCGHVEIGNHVGFGAYAGVHQFCRVGDHAYIGAKAALLKDVIPFALVGPDGDEAYIAGINSVGLERRGFDSDRRLRIKRAFKTLFRQNHTIAEALEILGRDYPDDTDIRLIIDFIKSSKRGIYRMNKDSD